VVTASERGGTVTLLFADLAGSTRLLAELGDAYAVVLRDYRRLMSEAAGAHQGSLVDTTGDGMFFRFPTARGALLAAVAAQRSMREHAWPESVRPEARIGIHTGEPLTSEESLVGMDVHRAARISAAGHGGQILLSLTAHDLLGGETPGGLVLRDLGEHRLKDVPRPERVFQASAADLPSEFPPIRTLDNWPNNLPRQLSTFVGRADQLVEAAQRLATTPLLMLTGPGGVGKTRLALELAARAGDQFPDGAWLVELASLGDGSLVLETVASTLRVKEQPGVPLQTTLANHLESRRLLLLFDNCEHVLDAAAQVIDELLHASGSLRVLATSREALGIAGESLYPVPSMDTPDTTSNPTIEQLEASDAVQLFVDRARAVQPAFTLNDHNASPVAQICRRLDGIPLAIELAAARVRALSPEQIAARLDDRFRLLTGGSRMALPRHRTLKAAVDWSFDLLSEAERTLFIRLSVFAGGFRLEAAEAACAGGVVERPSVLDLLSHLIDRSLVALDESSGAARYRLLDTLQQYAQERLIEDEQVIEVRGRHRDYMVELVERIGPTLFAGPQSGVALQELSEEHENLRAALQWSDEDPAGAGAELRLTAGLWRYWEIAGHLEEGRSWLTRALTRTDGEISELRATALTGLGSLAAQQGDFGAAESGHEEALRTHRQLGNPASIAYACSNLANVAAERGDFSRARGLYEECVVITRDASDARATAFALLNLADVAARQGDTDEARDLLDDSIATFRAEGDLMGVALALGRGAIFSLNGGDLEGARTRHHEALEIFRQFGDGRGVSRTLMFLGDIAAVGGELAEAERLYRASLEERHRLGDRGGVATACDRLARIAAASQPDRAARLIGFADAQREAIGVSLPPADAAERDQLLGSLEDRLGAGPLAALRGTGRRLRLEEALEEISVET
jgi:predicted ATPase/class 3 adenylate cyclase/predicted negative regulator of RcsB-dependent stress response